MATIRLRGRTYRAEVVRYGMRKSASFHTYEDARSWAKAQEDAILAEVAPFKLGPPPPEPSRIEHGELAPLGLVLAEEDILGLPRLKVAIGVYFLIKDSRIVYVGQSVDIHSRVSTHRGNWKEFDSYTYIACPQEMLNEVERYYIKTLRPPLNIAGVGNGQHTTA